MTRAGSQQPIQHHLRSPDPRNDWAEKKIYTIVGVVCRGMVGETLDRVAACYHQVVPNGLVVGLVTTMWSSDGVRRLDPEQLAV